MTSDNHKEDLKTYTIEEFRSTLFDRSDLTVWDYISNYTWWPLVRLSGRVYYNIKKTYQKIVKGRADEEIWDLGSHIVKYVYPRLKEYRDMDRSGFPYNGKDICTEEDWIKIVDKMIDAFRIYLEDENAEWTYYKDGIFDDEECSKCMSQMEEGFELFGKHFLALWD